MTMIFSPDPLRRKVEQQSHGQRTIIYSPKGQPNYVFIVPRFNLEDIDKQLGNGTHPAFIINDQPVDTFFYSCYSASLQNGELVSPLPVIWIYFNFSRSRRKVVKVATSVRILNGVHWLGLSVKTAILFKVIPTMAETI